MQLYLGILIWNNWRYDVKRIDITLRTLSPVILSSRMQGALYRDVDFFGEAFERYNMVYPFYSFDDRYNREGEFQFSHSYYIPASSLKGALTSQKNRKKLKGNYLFCRDIEVESKQIEVDSLTKFQYLYFNREEREENVRQGQKQPKLMNFFPKIGVERLKSAEKLIGTILIDDSQISIEELCKNLNTVMDCKIRNYQDEIEKIAKSWEEENNVAAKLNVANGIRINSLKKTNSNKNSIQELEKLKAELDELEKRLESFKKNSNNKKKKAIIFLGGYKGLLGSLTKKLNTKREEFHSAFYIDPLTNLPLGVVEIEFQI